MKIFYQVAVLGLIGVLATSPTIASGQTGKEGSRDEVESKTKGEAYQSAAAVDFRSQLQLGFDSLTSLGQRIELARRHADPVGLASAARELQAAESVSDQKASLTSKDLMNSAVELAKMRFDSDELKAVALLITDDQMAQELNKLAKQAKSAEEEAVAAAKEGAKSRGIYQDLVVDNHSHHHVHVYYNGRHLGHLDPHEHRHFHVHDHGHGHFFDLKATGHYRTWRRHVHGDFRDYHWTLH